MQQTQRQPDFEVLITELTKENPNTHVVKEQMLKLGLKYSDDTLEQLDTVLMALHPTVEDYEKIEAAP